MKNEERRSVSFSDADYQQAMRVDPLTTIDEIAAELKQLRKNKEQREQAEKEEQTRTQKDAGLVASENEDDIAEPAERKGREKTGKTV